MRRRPTTLIVKRDGEGSWLHRGRLAGSLAGCIRPMGQCAAPRASLELPLRRAGSEASSKLAQGPLSTSSAAERGSAHETRRRNPDTNAKNGPPRGRPRVFVSGWKSAYPLKIRNQVRIRWIALSARRDRIFTEFVLNERRTVALFDFDTCGEIFSPHSKLPFSEAVTFKMSIWRNQWPQSLGGLKASR